MTQLILTAAARRRSNVFPGLTGFVLPALVLVGFPGAGILHAQEEKLPKAEQILDKYVEVTGGKAAYEKLNNHIIKGTFEFVGMGIKANMTIYNAKPDKVYVLLESEAIGRIEEGTNGEVVWEISAMTGPRIKEGQERIDALRDATFNSELHWRKLYKKVECVGMETVDDKPCYKVVMTPNEGKPQTSYFDKESNLLVRDDAIIDTPMGSIPIESYPSDYKKVDGILMPHKASIKVMGQERLLIIESVEHNVKMPADRFKLPDDIQTLVDKAKAEKPKTEHPKPEKPEPKRP